MKLLLCRDCKDIILLRPEPKQCFCGKVGGRYLKDRFHAIFWGNPVHIGIRNEDLKDAVKNKRSPVCLHLFVNLRQRKRRTRGQVLARRKK